MDGIVKCTLFVAIALVCAILKYDMFAIYLLGVISSFILYKKNWANFTVLLYFNS